MVQANHSLPKTVQLRLGQPWIGWCLVHQTVEHTFPLWDMPVPPWSSRQNWWVYTYCIKAYTKLNFCLCLSWSASGTLSIYFSEHSYAHIVGMDVDGERQLFSYQNRTEKHCKKLLEEAKNFTTQKDRNKFCQDNSFHPVESGLWGFCEGDTQTGSSSWAFASDSMHNEDLGVFLYIINNMQVWKKCKCMYSYH